MSYVIVAVVFFAGGLGLGFFWGKGRKKAEKLLSRGEQLVSRIKE